MNLPRFIVAERVSYLPGDEGVHLHIYRIDSVDDDGQRQGAVWDADLFKWIAGPHVFDNMLRGTTRLREATPEEIHKTELLI